MVTFRKSDNVNVLTINEQRFKKLQFNNLHSHYSQLTMPKLFSNNVEFWQQGFEKNCDGCQPGVSHVRIVESPLEAVLLWVVLGPVERVLLRLQARDELQTIL